MFRVCRNRESVIKVSFEKCRTYDEALGVTFADAHHYQNTKEDSHSLHTVVVEVPIALSMLLMLGSKSWILDMKKSVGLFLQASQIA